MGGVKNFRRSFKFVKYCKTYKTYVADSESIKKKGEKIDSKVLQPKKF